MANIKRKRKRKKGYIDNEKFLELLKQFQDLNDDVSDWFEKSKPKNPGQEVFKLNRRELREKRIKLLGKETVEQRDERTNQLEKVKNAIGRMFILITEGMLKRPNFVNYDYYRKSEMISDASYFMTNYIDRYDTNRNNPFAYFSQITYNAFLQNINKTNKRAETFTPLTYIENMDTINNVILNDSHFE